MNKLAFALVLHSSLFILHSTSASATSPAATQAWVINYTATNAASSVVVSNASELVRAEVARGMSAVMEILRSDTSTNAVQRACDEFKLSILPAVNTAVQGAIGL